MKMGEEKGEEGKVYGDACEGHFLEGDEEKMGRFGKKSVEQREDDHQAQTGGKGELAGNIACCQGIEEELEGECHAEEVEGIGIALEVGGGKCPKEHEVGAEDGGVIAEKKEVGCCRQEEEKGSSAAGKGAQEGAQESDQEVEVKS